MELPIKHPENMVFNLGNCGIVAMAICASVPLDKATEWFRVKMRANRSWQGATHHHHYDEFLREHGVWFHRVDYDKARVRTIGDFADWKGNDGKYYAIRSAGHMMVCRNRYIADQNQIVSVDIHWKRNARIKNHWEIIR